jgi:hypothetical protein
MIHEHYRKMNKITENISEPLLLIERESQLLLLLREHSGT